MSSASFAAGEKHLKGRRRKKKKSFEAPKEPRRIKMTDGQRKKKMKDAKGKKKPLLQVRSVAFKR